MLTVALDLTMRGCMGLYGTVWGCMDTLPLALTRFATQFNLAPILEEEPPRSLGVLDTVLGQACSALTLALMTTLAMTAIPK